MLSLAGVAGQPHAVEFLRRSIKSGRLGHGYFFHGPAGVGKRTSALAFAAALNCESPPASGEVCGTCTPCREIAQGIYPDLILVSPEGDEGREKSFHIDQVSDAIKRASQTAHAGRTKVLILVDVHMMSFEAASRLLKVLEEPPANTVWILLSSEAARVLPTLKSRCQSVRFGLLSRSALAGLSAYADGPGAEANVRNCLGQAGLPREEIESEVAEAGRFIELARVMDLAGLSLEAQKYSRKSGNLGKLLDGLERVFGVGLEENPGAPDRWIRALDAVAVAWTRLSRHADRTLVEALGVELAFALKEDADG